MTRQMIAANTPWEENLCYSRAVRIGQTVAVSQTSAVDDKGKIAGGDDPYKQAVYALANVQDALHAAGAQVSDVIRLRIYLARFEDLDEVAKAYREVFEDIRPAINILTCTMVSSDILVEFDVDAVVAS